MRAADENSYFSNTTARIAGLLYLATIVAGIFAQVKTRSALFVFDDVGATAQNILAHQTLYRAGLASDLVMLCCYVAVTGLFYEMFKRTDKQLSLIAAGFSFTGIAVLAFNGLLHLAALVILNSSTLDAFSAAQIQALAQLALDLHGDGYGISLVFFGFYCALLGWLIFRSGFLPRFVGILMIFGGLCHIGNNFIHILSPEMAGHLPSALRYPPLIGELALALWLLIFGAKAGK